LNYDHLKREILPEVLSGKNYDVWIICMKNYLLAQNLWDVIESSLVPPSSDEEAVANWRRKNAEALHALLVSCAPKGFCSDKEKSVKDAWNTLAKLYKRKCQLLCCCCN
ncbi:hypothetical protein SLEP1_g57419, partial [Rubroshorea leprosula]